jgi:hypothetical protein
MAIGRLMLTVLLKEDSRMSSALMAMQDNGDNARFIGAGENNCAPRSLTGRQLAG